MTQLLASSTQNKNTQFLSSFKMYVRQCLVQLLAEPAWKEGQDDV